MVPEWQTINAPSNSVQQVDYKTLSTVGATSTILDPMQTTNTLDLQDIELKKMQESGFDMTAFNERRRQRQEKRLDN